MAGACLLIFVCYLFHRAPIILVEMNGSELLTCYRKTGSDAAFTGLLRRYTSLVYSVANRRLSNQSLAEDVTQMVFTRLAKAPPAIKADGELAAWLHRTTVHVAIDIWRSETRRRTREQEAVLMQSAPAEDARIWEEMTPHLDEALDQLTDDDRQAVLLRFFDHRSMRDIGVALGVSEDAAKMRVSRAVGRLREQLALRGVTCTAVILATFLTQRAVEAAPDHLLASLIAMKLAVPAAAGAGGISGVVAEMMRSKVVLGTAALSIAITAALILLHRSGPRAVGGESAGSQTVPPPARETSQPKPLPLLRVTASTTSVPEMQQPARFILRVVDQETGLGLPGANIRASYFYAGGVGERHETQTEADGNGHIPQPNHPEKNAGLNAFVSLEGYVPKCMNFHEMAIPTNYTLELEPALTVGGKVVDGQGRPVAGVELEAHRKESYKEGRPNTDFQTSKVQTDTDGSWRFPHVPKSYEVIEFRLTCSNYAVTRLAVPVGKPESLNMTLVIERGRAVVGQVTDAEGRPIAGATVQEKHNYGSREVTGKTDPDGRFELRGLGTAGPPHVDPSDPTRCVGTFPPPQTVDIVVQMKGMAPQAQPVPLVEPTNYVNVVLAKAIVFRGRVVDEAGKPIPGAVVRTDYDFERQIPTQFEWLTHTDADGRFTWDSAPVEPLCFWFEADGYEIIRGRRMLPDGTDLEVKLTRKRVGSGSTSPRVSFDLKK